MHWESAFNVYVLDLDWALMLAADRPLFCLEISDVYVLGYYIKIFQ